MPETLPRLRMDLDFSRSPVPDRPGLLIRDPYRYSDAALIIPPALVRCLEVFDGQQTDLDLRASLVQITGELQVGELERHLVDSLKEAGFLEDDVYDRLKAAQHTAFAAANRRVPSHAGGAYPEDPAALKATFDGYLDGLGKRSKASLAGLAAPHVSPEGGCRAYGAAYASLGAEYRDRTFVILGTSHYGEPDRFGLTRKPFLTPLGEARNDVEIAGYLEAEGGPAVKMEDYCHAVEHSIEFQVVFLQYLFGAGVKIVPILCGPFARAFQRAAVPEDDDNVRRFFEALCTVAERDGERLFWVLGIDMAHMGPRYGDGFTVRAHEGEMSRVEAADRKRIELALAGDAPGFWAEVREGGDPLRWCGAAPLYTFLRAVPNARGELLEYDQWNIDEVSVVTFGAMSFSA